MKRGYKLNWTKMIAWAWILTTAYIIWFKMVPGAIEYIKTW